MNTWLISPNWLAWILLSIASFSLGAIAVRMWHTPKNGAKWNVPNNSNKIHFGVGELYKTTILTAWLAFSAWLMWRVCNIPMATNEADFWSKLIAILGIIVATLIGWQIYSAMDWNSKIERLSKIEKMYNDISMNVEGNRNYSEATYLAISAARHLDLALKEPKEYKENFTDIYLSFLKAIKLFGDSSVEESIENCISNLYAILDYMRWNEVQLNDDFHSKCEAMYEDIKNTNRFITKAQLGKLFDVNCRRNAIKNGTYEENY